MHALKGQIVTIAGCDTRRDIGAHFNLIVPRNGWGQRHSGARDHSSRSRDNAYGTGKCQGARCLGALFSNPRAGPG